MTRYKVEFEVNGDEEALRKFGSDLTHFQNANQPGYSGWSAVKDSLKVTEVVPQFGLRSKWAGDKRWEAILAKVDELAQTYPRSSRHSPMEDGSTVWCKAFFYTDSTCVERYLFLIGAQQNKNGVVEVKVEGPYEDSGDAYWHQMLVRDKREGNAIITDDYEHYTVQKDSLHPGQGDGHGGTEFRFVIESPQIVQRLVELGLNIQHQKDSKYAEGEQIKYNLTTRNLWSQGTIPQKHRHLFKPNAEGSAVSYDFVVSDVGPPEVDLEP